MPKDIETSIHIAAAPQQVWEALSSSPDWGAWNPFVLEVKGQAVPGRQIQVTVRMAGATPMLFRPWVLKAEPGRELRWVGRVIGPWIFSGEHYFILEPKDGGTLLTHGEKFRGLFTFLLKQDKLAGSFEAFNQGLKRKVEGS